jgi:hypothetical protein
MDDSRNWGSFDRRCICLSHAESTDCSHLYKVWKNLRLKIIDLGRFLRSSDYEELCVK